MGEYGRVSAHPELTPWCLFGFFLGIQKEVRRPQAAKLPAHEGKESARPAGQTFSSGKQIKKDIKMKILALESSATACSAALWGEGGLIAQSFQNSGLTHSRTLLPMAHDLLKNCGTALEQVDVIAVAAGPGSFTGLRIGVATAKGLAWGADKDCAACSTLESMAWPLAFYEDAVVVCAMDARRRQVYNALFHTDGEKLERLTPDRAISLEELGEELKKIPKRKIVVGDGAKLCYNTLREMEIQLELAPEPLRMQSAWGVARAAAELVQAGKLVKGQDLVPVYHRLSQAERERLERERRSRENEQ